MINRIAFPLSVAGIFFLGFAPSFAHWPTDGYKAMVAAVQKAKKVVLYEGLPHQQLEADKLRAELKRKKTKRLHGFPFYEEPLALKKEDAKALKALVCDPTSFKPAERDELLGIIKLCGEFHPDYCVEWQTGERVYRVLVCFGCCEVKFYGAMTELYCDMQSVAQKEFAKILKPYQKNRPKK